MWLQSNFLGVDFYVDLAFFPDPDPENGGLSYSRLNLYTAIYGSTWFAPLAVAFTDNNGQIHTTTTTTRCSHKIVCFECYVFRLLCANPNLSTGIIAHPFYCSAQRKRQLESFYYFHEGNQQPTASPLDKLSKCWL